jgi:cytochrome c551/c552
MRLEPNFSEVASQILTDPGLNDQERGIAAELVDHPDSAEARTLLARAIRDDAALASGAAPAAAPAGEPATDDGNQPPAKPRLTRATHALADALKDVDVAGRFRKPGPSLRHLDSKVDFNWLFSWIRRPADFRPTTRMPQFFLHYQHLDGEKEAFPIHDIEGELIGNVNDVEYTKRFENIEIRALSEFLLANSQPFTYLDPAPGVTEPASGERGKMLFETRGCLACHSHVDFPGINSTQGPDLSRIAAKFQTEKGRRWLYSWIKAPNHYHARTAMPNLFLDPIAETDASGNPTGRVTDPALDITTYLLGVSTDWQPEAPVPPRTLTAEEQAALNDLTTVWLSASFPRRRAAEFAKNGIDERLRSTVKVDEQVLVGDFRNNPQERAQRQLEYVARRSLSRYGCFGCHDIPGFETAKPIGTPLASWGRKDPAQLAFENIGQFLAKHGIDGEGKSQAEAPSQEHQATEGASDVGSTTAADESHSAHADAHELDPLDDKYTRDEAYFLQSINSHQRNGFLWQKLRMPRSFDFETTRTKRYDERLRMPKFPFTEEEREAVMTFILGLTNEAPAERYIYRPGPRQQAIVDGRHVLDKYNCAGCHVLDMDRWDIAFQKGSIESAPAINDYPFLAPHFTPEQIKASQTPDRRGLLRAELHGMPVLNEETGAPLVVDADAVPIEPDDTESAPYFQFMLFRHALVDGEPRLVGAQNLMIPGNRARTGPALGEAYPGKGGDLAKYLYPRVVAAEKQINPNVVASGAWGWLPPPLHDEGDKVQTDWLHDFLMDPTLIRPAVVLRMPNFHMTSDEASKLVNYFAAKSNAQFPYEYNERRRGGYLAEAEAAHQSLLGDAMKIVTDGNYCVKCHSIGDYQVRGDVKALGPRLDEVYKRLRPQYTRHWVANPLRILPYTGMPVNIPFEPAPPLFGGVSQSLFPGPSFVQLDGVIDLLMNFDVYTARQTSVKGLVREAPAAAPGQPPAAAPGQPPARQPSASEQPPNDRSAQR